MNAYVHDCRALLCTTPHSPLDWHRDECGCQDCHEGKTHDWREWTVFPECGFCADEAKQWFQDNLQDLPWKDVAMLVGRAEAAWEQERQKRITV